MFVGREDAKILALRQLIAGQQSRSSYAAAKREAEERIRQSKTKAKPHAGAGANKKTNSNAPRGGWKEEGRDGEASMMRPPILVFVQSKERAIDVYRELAYDGLNLGLVHSGMPRTKRVRSSLWTSTFLSLSLSLSLSFFSLPFLFILLFLFSLFFLFVSCALRQSFNLISL